MGSVGSAEQPFFTGQVADGRIGVRVQTPTIAEHGYLTPQPEWGVVERGNPLPYTLAPETRREIGLDPETWRLDVATDPDTDAEIEAPLSIDFASLLEIGKRDGVRLLKGVTCNNIGEPLGMGLWEGVPLRVLIWMTRPLRNIRRVVYWGYHNDDPAQMFQSSLPIGRVLEEPPCDLPCGRVPSERRPDLRSTRRTRTHAGAGGVRLQIGQVVAARRAHQQVRRQRYVSVGQQRPRQPDEDVRSVLARALVGGRLGEHRSARS